MNDSLSHEGQSRMGLLERRICATNKKSQSARFGTGNATSSEFLATVAPDYAVISVGPNTSGYPSQDTITRLQASGATIYRTDAGPLPLSFESDGVRVTAPPTQ